MKTLLEGTFGPEKGIIDTDWERVWNWLKEPITLEKDFKQEIKDKIFACLREGKPLTQLDTSDQKKPIRKS